MLPRVLCRQDARETGEQVQAGASRVAVSASRRGARIGAALIAGSLLTLTPDAAWADDNSDETPSPAQPAPSPPPAASSPAEPPPVRPSSGKPSVANAVAEADDAFGGTFGLENVGIYTDTDVRGFNPQRAGNARVDGVYFDQLTFIPLRVREGSDIRVGFTALPYPSPAPTGILAHRIRPVGDRATINLGAHAFQYGGHNEEIYAQMPIVADHFGIGAGVGYNHSLNSDGAVNKTFNLGVITRLRIGGIEIKTVHGAALQGNVDARPIITTDGPFVPHSPKIGRYLGQRWADTDSNHLTNGVTIRAPLPAGFGFRGGFFQSRIDRLRNYTEIFAVHDTAGHASHFMLIDPVQHSHANSWDALLSYRFGSDRLRHTMMVQYKGRRRHVESGGSDFFDFGTVVFGERDPEPRPQTQFSKLTVGRLAQDNYSLGYIGRLAGVGQVNIGVTRTIYHAETRSPLGITRSSARPWLYNASVMIQPTRHLSLYAGYVTGLEDSGIAPENALNRNEQLPASPTRQIDAGIKLDIARMSLVASVFQISKPYFSFDGVGNYVQIGKVRHRGIEVSASGKLTSRLQILAGAVMMDPVVTGFAVDAGLHGKLPVGTTRLHAKIDGNYRTDIFGGLTFTLAMLHDGRRAISSAPYHALHDRQLMLPAQTTFDLGARQNFTLGRAAASFRLVIGNIFNQRGWKILAPNSLQPDETRRYNLYLYVDF